MDYVGLPVPENLGLVNNEYLIVIVLLTVIFLGVIVFAILRIEKLTKLQLEYNKNKNDHMERLAENFSETTKEMVEKVVAVHESVRAIAERNENMVDLAKASLDNNSRQLEKIFNHFKK